MSLEAANLRSLSINTLPMLRAPLGIPQEFRIRTSTNPYPSALNVLHPHIAATNALDSKLMKVKVRRTQYPEDPLH